MEISTREKSRLVQGAFILMVLASILFAVKAVAEIKGLRFIGGGAPAGNTISFSGEGEVRAAPDIAMINLTIREEAKTVADAQTKATAKEKSVLEYLDTAGIAKKDIKTENYNSYPTYDYGTPCYAGGYGMPCRQESPKVIGYEVSEYISVKVRDLAKAGEIVKGLGSLAVGEMSGPDFSIENEDKLKEEARKMAIEEAKAKAESLADDLGVRLVRIVNFTEDGNYPVYNFVMAEKAMDASAGVAPAPAPELPTGETKITSNVTITYEIR